MPIDNSQNDFPFNPRHIHSICANELIRITGCNRSRYEYDRRSGRSNRKRPDLRNHPLSDLVKLSEGSIESFSYCGAVVTKDDLAQVYREGFWMDHEGNIIPTDRHDTPEQYAAFAKIVRLVKAEYYIRENIDASVQAWFEQFKVTYSGLFYACRYMFTDPTLPLSFDEFIDLRARFGEKVSTPVFISDNGEPRARTAGKLPRLNYIDVSMPALGENSADGIELNKYRPLGNGDRLKEGYKTRILLAAKLHTGPGPLFLLEPNAFIKGLKGKASDIGLAKQCFFNAIKEVAGELGGKQLRALVSPSVSAGFNPKDHLNLRLFGDNSVDRAIASDGTTILMGNPIQPDGNGGPSDGGKSASEEYIARITAGIALDLPRRNPIKPFPTLYPTPTPVNDGSGGGGASDSDSDTTINEHNILHLLQKIVGDDVLTPRGDFFKFEEGVRQNGYENVLAVDDDSNSENTIILVLNARPLCGIFNRYGIQCKINESNDTIIFTKENKREIEITLSIPGFTHSFNKHSTSQGGNGGGAVSGNDSDTAINEHNILHLLQKIVGDDVLTPRGDFFKFQEGVRQNGYENVLAVDDDSNSENTFILVLNARPLCDIFKGHGIQCKTNESNDTIIFTKENKIQVQQLLLTSFCNKYGFDKNNLDAENKNKVTPLTVAVERKDLTMISLLLSTGADANKINGHGNSAISLANRKNDTDIIRTLKRYMDKSKAGNRRASLKM